MSITFIASHIKFYKYLDNFIRYSIQTVTVNVRLDRLNRLNGLGIGEFINKTIKKLKDYVYVDINLPKLTVSGRL